MRYSQGFLATGHTIAYREFLGFPNLRARTSVGKTVTFTINEHASTETNKFSESVSVTDTVGANTTVNALLGDSAVYVKAFG